MQRIETSRTRVTDLAAEFGLSIDDMLDLCEMLGVVAHDAGSIIDDEGLARLRGVASGEIDPEDLGVSTSGPPDDTGVDGAGRPVSAEAGPRRLGALQLPVIGDRPDLPDLARGSGRHDRADRRTAGEDLPQVPTTSWWAQHLPGGTRFDGYVPRWLRAVYVVSVLAVLGILWFVFGPSGGDDASSSALFAPAPDLEVGSCFNADAGLWLDSATVVGCAGPHDAQAAAVIELIPAARAYPNLDDLRSEAVVLCVDHLRGVVDLEDFESVGVSVPSAPIWESGDQRVLCSIVHGSGDKLVGSSL